MTTRSLSEIFESAQGHHKRNGYDIAEAVELSHLEAERILHWHHSLALAINNLEITSLEKLEVFSECILNLGRELSHLPGQERLPF